MVAERKRAMSVFQVSSRSVQLAAPPKKRTRRFPSQWYLVARAVVSGLIGAAIFTSGVADFTEAEAQWSRNAPALSQPGRTDWPAHPGAAPERTNIYSRGAQ